MFIYTEPKQVLLQFLGTNPPAAGQGPSVCSHPKKAALITLLCFKGFVNGISRFLAIKRDTQETPLSATTTTIIGRLSAVKKSHRLITSATPVLSGQATRPRHCSQSPALSFLKPIQHANSSSFPKQVPNLWYYYIYLFLLTLWQVGNASKTA